MAKVNFSTYTGNLTNVWNAIKATGGQINFDEAYRQLTGATVNWAPDVGYQVGLLCSGDKGNRIELNRGGSAIGFYMNNLTDLVFRDMVIHGMVSGGATPDCAAAIYGSYVRAMKIESCVIAGIRTAAGNAVIHAGTSSWLHLNHLQLGGHTADAVARLDGGYGLLAEDATFYDYQTIGNVYHSKTPGGVGAWIDAINAPAGNGASEPMVTVRFCQFDEGATRGININGYKFTSEQNRFNVNNAGYGIYLTNVPDARSVQDHFGYTAADRPAIKMINSRARVEGMTIDGGVTRIEVDATSVLDLVNSPGVVVDAAAGSIVTVDGIRRKNGIVQIG